MTRFRFDIGLGQAADSLDGLLDFDVTGLPESLSGWLASHEAPLLSVVSGGAIGPVEALAWNAMAAFGSPLGIPVPMLPEPQQFDSAAKGSSGSGSGGTGSTTGVVASYTTGANNGISDAAEYNIQIKFSGTLWTQASQKAFIDAANQLASYIIADIPNVTIVGGGKQVVDDIVITAELQNIDGVNGILGQAGPTALRTGSYLPATAKMTFDAADASALQTSGYWDEVVLHEMIHSIGFGSIWSYKGLVKQVSATEAFYTGANGNAAYLATYAGADTRGIAVETDGGSGTALAHWDEATFGTELMTGWLNTAGGVADPLSTMSVASLADLGYTLNSAYLFA